MNGLYGLCRTFHTVPEQGQGPTPIVAHCSGTSPCPGNGHSQCGYTMILLKLYVNNCRQHRGRIIGVAYSATGDYLYSADSNGSLALYEVGDNRYQVLRVLTNTVARGDHRAPQALTVSPDGQHVAFVGPTEFTVTVVSGSSLDEVGVCTKASGLLRIVFVNLKTCLKMQLLYCWLV